MSQPFPHIDIGTLDAAEKLELITLLWESFPDSTESLPIPEWHRQVIENRLVDADAAPDAAIPWDQVLERLRRKS